MARKSNLLNTTGLVSNTSNRVSNISITPLSSPRINNRASQINSTSIINLGLSRL